MDIKEIALKLQATDRFRLNVSELSAIEFAEALIAEIAKQNEPVCEWVKSDNGNYLVQKWAKDYVAIQGDKLYTVPPTAEQIANETAEACAELADKMNPFPEPSAIGPEIRSGEWRKFVKEV